ncbi:MAG: hypothetical protein KME42_24820 [Tildeniella nuda ZEHNDER 1965/U140]|nr:hypothetical protein [Tildeniella nuda ZEHNDER 1965/U140]
MKLRSQAAWGQRPQTPSQLIVATYLLCKISVKTGAIASTEEPSAGLNTIHYGY